MKTIKDAYKYYGESVLDKAMWSCIYYNSKEGRFMDFFFLAGKGWYAICTRKEFEDYAKMQKLNSINKETEKPVYTQEMAAFSVRPSVGMICDIEMKHRTIKTKGEFIGALITFVGESFVVFNLREKEFCFYIESVVFKPTDTRTDKEKLIDDLIQGAALTSSIDRDLIGKILEGYKVESGG